MSQTTVSFPIDIWNQAKGKEDLRAWILSVQPELEGKLQEQDEGALLRYELDHIDFPKKRIPILLEISEEEDDTEIVALIPQRGLFASGNTKEEAKTNLWRSIEEDYLRLKGQRNLLGQKLLSKLEFFERNRSGIAARISTDK
ncbi:MAG: hypothetical protein AB1797_08740 [bacterium]